MGKDKTMDDTAIRAQAAAELLAMQPLKFEDWLAQLAPEFAKQSDMTEQEARAYVQDAGEDCWREWWADAYSPAECVSEDMSYWGE